MLYQPVLITDLLDESQLLLIPVKVLFLVQQKEGVETLYKAMPALAADPTTYDLTKAYLLDEEEDLYWDEEQLALIEKIGYQNWLVKQL